MNSLSNDVLLEIFEKLDSKSIIAASKVCERWSQLIRESSSIMMRFMLTIYIAEDQSFEESGKIANGKYQYIYLNGLLKANALSSKFYEHMAYYRECARIFAFQNFYFDDLISTINVLNEKKITLMLLDDCDINTDRACSIEMTNLNELELIDSTEFLKHIKVDCLKCLKINNTQNTRTTSNISELLNSFLSTHDNLKQLKLTSINNNLTPIEFNIDKINFSLSSLTVSDSIISNLRGFILKQKDSLKSLGIHFEFNNAELIQAIFFDLNLTELVIEVAVFPKHFSSTEKNSTIKKLVIESSDPIHNIRVRLASRNQEDLISHFQQALIFHNQLIDYRQNSFGKVEKIISLCSAVEEIAIYGFDFTKDDFLTPIHDLQPNLKVLVLSTVPNVISSNIQFDNLTCFEIEKIEGEHDIKNLGLCAALCPNMKIVKIHTNMDAALYEIFSNTLMTNAKKLEEIYIGDIEVRFGDNDDTITAKKVQQIL